MGNSNVTLAIATDRHDFVAGSEISGRAYLNVSEPKGINLNTIRIRLEGEEKCTVHHTTPKSHRRSDGSTRRSTANHYARSGHVFLRVEYTLASFSNGKLGAGQYEFPFLGHIPPGVPSTMYCAKGESNCQICYRITAQTEGSVKKETSSVINVSAAPRPYEDLLSVPVLSPPDTQNVNFFCCVNKGSMTIRAEAERGIVSRGEQLEVGFACQNNSSVAMEGVDVKLTERLRWSAKGHHEVSSNIIANVKIEPQHVIGSDKDTFDTCDIFENQPLQKMKLNISNNARDSYKGTNLQIEHPLTVKLKTKRCITNPEACMSIFVQPSILIQNAVPIIPMIPSNVNPSSEPEIYLPTDWSPQTASIVEIPTVYGVLGGGEDGAPSAPILKNPNDLESGDNDYPATSAPLVSSSSIKNIYGQMNYAFDQWGVIDRISCDDNFIPTLKNLSPDEFGALLSKVRSAIDQPRCAKRLAELIGDKFTCAHISVACSLLGELYRSNIVLKTAPLAVDLETGKELIWAQLNSFQRIQCTSVLGFD